MPRAPENELVFLPLGGVGEIGMNLALYGYGPRHDRTWIAVDFGVSFAHADLPGVDLVFPDIGYLEEERINLLGIVITHAHEDHFGALVDLWPRLEVPVYATAFTANLLAAKIASEPDAAPVPVNVVKAGRPHRARAVRGRIHQRRPLHPRIQCACHPHAARPRSAQRRLEARRSADRRPADRRGAAEGHRRGGRSGAHLGLDQRHARGPQPERDARSSANSPRSSARRRGGGSPSRRLRPMSGGCARSRSPPARPVATWSSSAAPCAGSSTSRPSSACSTIRRPSSPRRPMPICRATRSWCS